MPAFNIIEDFQVKTNQAFLEKAAALEPVLHQTAVAAAGIVHITTKPRQYSYRRGLFLCLHPVFTEGDAEELFISLL